MELFRYKTAFESFLEVRDIKSSMFVSRYLFYFIPYKQCSVLCSALIWKLEKLRIQNTIPSQISWAFLRMATDGE